MNKLYFNEQGDLILQYSVTNVHENDYDIISNLNTASFTLEQKNDKLRTYKYKNDGNEIICFGIIKHFINYFRESDRTPLDVDKDIIHKLQILEQENEYYNEAIDIGSKKSSTSELILGTNFNRELKSFQKESVEHLLNIRNGANFSVPGSGKTTITYAAISKWLDDGIIEKIMVIGPTSSFLPWEEEYKGCFNLEARPIRIKGKIAEMLKNIGDSYDLFLLHYMTAHNKRNELMNFLKKWKTVLIIDESHNIKSPNQGPYANAALFLAQFATRRIILTGTPIPNNYQDLWTQITFLWPHNRPLGEQQRYNFDVKKQELDDKYRDVLSSLFRRIKKKDLNLPKVNPTIYRVNLEKHQREIYDVIAEKTLDEIESLSEMSHLQKFRVAKMIRLLQTASNPSLLYEMSNTFNINSPLFETPEQKINSQFGFEVDLIDYSDLTKLSIFDKIKNYSEIEIPAKMHKVATLVQDLINDDKKVIIWSSFLLNMDIFKNRLLEEFNPILINGSVSKEYNDDPNRDQLLNLFKDDPSYKILIATPASLGESVSLHKNNKGETVCADAIYLDRNFNGAQYMQSLDRIHRIGMDADTIVNYHLVIGNNTIDESIHQRLVEKSRNMEMALNDDFLTKMEFNEISVSESESKQDYNSLVQHLRNLRSVGYGN